MAIPKTNDAEHLGEHIKYEIWMLSQTLPLSEGMVDPSAPDVGRVRLNAYVESFCFHARTLIEFFTDNNPKNLCAKRFAVPTYSPLNRKSLESFVPKLNMQIAHAVFHGRTSNEAEKIGAERRQMLVALKDEVAHFKKLRRPEFINVNLPDVELPKKRPSSRPTTTNAIIEAKGPIPSAR